MLRAMHDLSAASDSKSAGVHASDAPIVDTLETVRSEAHAGSEAPANQSVLGPADPGPEQSVPAGALGRLFSKISTDPIEILQALDDLSGRIGERVLREIQAFRQESEAQHKVQDAKIDALYKLYDGLCRELDGMRKQMRLLVAMFALQLVFLGALITVELMNWFSMERAFASPPSVEMQVPMVGAEESASALDSSPPDSTPASAAATRPGLDTAEESEPTLPSGP